MPLSSREIIRKLVADGWVEVAQKGSHKQFRHPTRPGSTTVPHPKKELPIGTIRAIERQSGVKLL
ncbi:MAG TPA: type II toxin-antitoxin system HicA family toxin [Geminicoccaceae bacterium]|nr:type II toxin-antitoxin system HicA family toxin [Geminicoccus sp.]HMU52858.1 type II toxin-antitoxin system HicA family toxin [Geminicoccaceae bacterium]